MSVDSLLPVFEKDSPRTDSLALPVCHLRHGAVFSVGSKPDYDLCATVEEFHLTFLGRRIGWNGNKEQISRRPRCLLFDTRRASGKEKIQLSGEMGLGCA